jgi:phosphoribosylaminoimidazolecarboxamide formyltransferase/IMP cyclohydrolase
VKRFGTEFSLENALLFSDAFLPFPDLVEDMHRAGLRRLVQPGGSKNDTKVLDRARELGVRVDVTGRRHFWH